MNGSGFVVFLIDMCFYAFQFKNKAKQPDNFLRARDGVESHYLQIPIQN